MLQDPPVVCSAAGEPQCVRRLSVLIHSDEECEPDLTSRGSNVSVVSSIPGGRCWGG